MALTRAEFVKKVCDEFGIEVGVVSPGSSLWERVREYEWDVTVLPGEPTEPNAHIELLDEE